MKTVEYLIKDLIGAEYNPREISDKQLADLKDSIKRFGFVEPIIVNINKERKNIIISGHQRVKAANALEIKEVPCLELDLTLDKEKELNVRMNKAGGEWDLKLLQENFDLPDLIEWGFDEKDLNFEVEENEKDDEVPDLPEEPTAKLGDIYILGKHRVMCGDSTSIDDVEKLMDGNKADMVFTDPPYGIGYQDTKKKHSKIIGDEELSNIQDLLSLVLINECPIYICCNWKCYSEFEKIMTQHDKEPKSCIVWDKETRVQNLDKFYKQHEFILYYGLFGGQKTLDGDVWRLKREVRKDHPTAKPVELITKAIGYTILPNQTVQDLFLGSGSTLIACEKTNRICYGMELDPKYCDVIVKRWEEYTGNKAELLTSESTSKV